MQALHFLNFQWMDFILTREYYTYQTSSWNTHGDNRCIIPYIELNVYKLENLVPYINYVKVLAFLVSSPCVHVIPSEHSLPALPSSSPCCITNSERWEKHKEPRVHPAVSERKGEISPKATKDIFSTLGLPHGHSPTKSGKAKMSDFIWESRGGSCEWKNKEKRTMQGGGIWAN